MNSTAIRRGVACWVCWSLCGSALYSSALYAQEKISDEPKQGEAKSASAAAEEQVRKLRDELAARAVQLEKMEKELKLAQSAREMLSVELEKMRHVLEAAAKEKKAAEDQAGRQAHEMAAKMRELVARHPGKDGQEKSPGNSFAEWEAARKGLEAAG